MERDREVQAIATAVRHVLALESEVRDATVDIGIAAAKVDEGEPLSNREMTLLAALAAYVGRDKVAAAMSLVCARTTLDRSEAAVLAKRGAR